MRVDAQSAIIAAPQEGVSAAFCSKHCNADACMVLAVLGFVLRRRLCEYLYCHVPSLKIALEGTGPTCRRR